MEKAIIAAQRQIFDTVVHDLKSPLAAIITSANIMTTTLNKPDWTTSKKIDLADKKATDITAIAWRMNNMLVKVLEFSRLEQLHQLDLRMANLSFTLAQVFEAELLPLANDKQQKMQLNAEGGILLPIDVDEIIRAITNLVSNAVRYTPNEGLIEVNLRKEGENVIIEVIDSGIGIEPENLPNLFKPFFRVESKYSHEGNIGLGLPTVKRIVELHNGTIDVNSEVGKGTIFRIVLPV